MFNRESFTEFLKYSIVGVSGLLINIVFLYIFTEVFHLYYLISSIFSFAIATLNNFLLNKVWTFEENLKDTLLFKGTKFFIVSSVSLFVNIFFLYFFTSIIGIYYLFSQILASGFTLISNFTGNKFWTFKRV